MGLQYRAIRAAASVLLVAAAVGTGGMAGMTSALAAGPATVTIAGTVVDVDGAPLAGVHLVITEVLPPDGGSAALQAITAADGSFTADVFAWGTAEAPADLRITTPADEAIEVVGQSCSQTWGIAVDVERQVALAEAAPDPLTLTATTTLLGEVCGTTGTPAPDPPGTGNSGAGGDQPALTPPPTDTVDAPAAAAGDRVGPALTIGFVVGLVVVTLLRAPRIRARRRD